MDTNTTSDIFDHGFNIDYWEHEYRDLITDTRNLNWLKMDLMELFSLQFRRIFNILKKLTNPTEINKGLAELISFYYKHKNIVHKKVVYKIMRRELPSFCVQKQISDSGVVCDILRCIDDMNNHIPSSLAVFMMSAMNCQHHLIIDPSSPDEPPITHLKYFLHHSQKMKFTFGGKRLQELILDANPDHLITTVLYSDTNAVITLLQYGARMCSEISEPSAGTQMLLACALEFIIYCGVTNSLWDSSGKLKIQPMDFTAYIKRMLKNFQIILQTVPNPHLWIRKLAGMDLGNQKMRIMDVQHLQVFLGALYPNEELAIVRAPSLMHLCRAAIRQELFENWQLPQGIQCLNLAQRVRAYINLVAD